MEKKESLQKLAERPKQREMDACEYPRVTIRRPGHALRGNLQKKKKQLGLPVIHLWRYYPHCRREAVDDLGIKARDTCATIGSPCAIVQEYACHARGRYVHSDQALERARERVRGRKKELLRGEYVGGHPREQSQVHALDLRWQKR